MSFGDTYLTVLGWVGSDPDFKDFRQNPQTTFRLGSTPRQFDRTSGRYLDKPTTWFTVQCWRGLAQNVFESIRIGQPVIVTGRLRTHEWTDDAGEQHSRVILEAFSLGHDLNRGTTTFMKSRPRTESPAISTPDFASDSAASFASDSTPAFESDSIPAFGSDSAPAEATATPYPPDEYSVAPLPLSASTDRPESAAA